MVRTAAGAKAPQGRGFWELSVPDWARLRSNLRVRWGKADVNTPKVPNGQFHQVLDGRAEDRGIEPLRRLPAVQRFAGVPSTHTGSVLRSNARQIGILENEQKTGCDCEHNR